MNVAAPKIDSNTTLAIFWLRGSAFGVAPVNDAVDKPAVPRSDLSALLLAVAVERDREAFALLFQKIAPRLKTYLMRSGTMAQVAEELAQETMLAVWRKAGSFDPSRAGAATWIFTIARNLRIDHHRRERLVDPIDYEPDDEPDPQPSIEAATIAAERDARVRTAIATLSDDQAAVVRLSFFGDKPQSEIARELGIPLGTVKSRVRLAMARLRGLLGDES